MMKRHLHMILVLVALVSVLVGAEEKRPFPVLKGPYIGQIPSGRTPKIFAPGIVSVGMHTRDIAMTPDGNEIYFCVSVGENAWMTILVTRLREGRWSEPEIAPFAADPGSISCEPVISMDGKRFFFTSNRSVSKAESGEKNWDIWVMERTASGWGEAKNLGAPVNSPAGEYFPSIARSGNLYFTRENPDRSNSIYRSRWQEGRYSEPEKLPVQVNCGQAQFNAFIDPEERFIIVPVYGRKDSLGSTDYYVVFRNPDDTWGDPRNLGPAINTAGGLEYSPYVSPDGKYFFFMSGRMDDTLLPAGEKMTWKRLREIHNLPGNGNPAIWWVDASVIEELAPNQSRSNSAKPIK